MGHALGHASPTAFCLQSGSNFTHNSPNSTIKANPANKMNAPFLPFNCRSIRMVDATTKISRAPMIAPSSSRRSIKLTKGMSGAAVSFLDRTKVVRSRAHTDAIKVVARRHWF